MTKEYVMPEAKAKAIEENIERALDFVADEPFDRVREYAEITMFWINEILKNYGDREKALAWKEVFKKSWNEQIEKRGLVLIDRPLARKIKEGKE